MKKSIVAFVVLCGVIAWAVVHSNLQKPSASPPAPVVEPEPPAETQAGPGKSIGPKQAELRMVSAPASEPAVVAAPAPAEVSSAAAATALSRTLDALLSDKTSFSDRQALWRKLKAAGTLEQAIAELKQRAAGSPDDPAIPIAIGLALMNKYPIADPDESAMTGLQMDQSFNKALKLDPANWEAQFFKASEMAYWPAEFNKGPEVIQRFSALIDQQETMPAQPQFAQPYALLGDYYQKAGHPDQAAATWQLGLAKFPNDPTLQKKINSR